MTIHLRVLSGVAESERVERAFALDTVTIGRRAECHFQLASSDVSLRHCSIAQEAGKVFIRDEGSLNGVFVKGRRIREKAELGHGDLFRVAGVVFQIGIDLPLKQRREEDSEEAAALRIGRGILLAALAILLAGTCVFSSGFAKYYSQMRSLRTAATGNSATEGCAVESNGIVVRFRRPCFPVEYSPEIVRKSVSRDLSQQTYGDERVQAPDPTLFNGLDAELAGWSHLVLAGHGYERIRIPVRSGLNAVGTLQIEVEVWNGCGARSVLGQIPLQRIGDLGGLTTPQAVDVETLEQARTTAGDKGRRSVARFKGVLSMEYLRDFPGRTSLFEKAMLSWVRGPEPKTTVSQGSTLILFENGICCQITVAATPDLASLVPGGIESLCDAVFGSASIERGDKAIKALVAALGPDGRIGGTVPKKDAADLMRDPSFRELVSRKASDALDMAARSLSQGAWPADLDYSKLRDMRNLLLVAQAMDAPVEREADLRRAYHDLSSRSQASLSQAKYRMYRAASEGNRDLARENRAQIEKFFVGGENSFLSLSADDPDYPEWLAFANAAGRWAVFASKSNGPERRL